MILLDSAKPFYKANFHLHTTNSDGRRSPEEAIALYREQGYDVLAITDHWKVTRESHLDEGMLVLSGVEFDFNLPGQVIHMLGLGVQPDILDKVSRASGPQRAADEISRQGGVAVLASFGRSWHSHIPFGLLFNFQGTFGLFDLVEMRRIELLTPCLQGRCSPR